MIYAPEPAALILLVLSVVALEKAILAREILRTSHQSYEQSFHPLVRQAYQGQIICE